MGCGVLLKISPKTRDILDKTYFVRQSFSVNLLLKIFFIRKLSLIFENGKSSKRVRKRKMIHLSVRRIYSTFQTFYFQGAYEIKIHSFLLTLKGFGVSRFNLI